MSDHIRYRDSRAWKYRLLESYQMDTSVKLLADINTPPTRPYTYLNVNGGLTIKKGYAWDGPSGPAPDFRFAMRGSLVHDALYQLMRSGGLELGRRREADDLLRDCMVEDGAPRWLAWLFWVVVRTFGARYAHPQPESSPPVKTAP